MSRTEGTSTADEPDRFAPRQLGRSAWMLRSYDHVRGALADPQRFSSNVRGADNEVFRSSPLVFDDREPFDKTNQATPFRAKCQAMC